MIRTRVHPKNPARNGDPWGNRAGRVLQTTQKSLEDMELDGEEFLGVFAEVGN
jgi:hypothetical protein